LLFVFFGCSKVDEETFYEGLKELRWGLTRAEMATLYHRFEVAGKVPWKSFVEYCVKEVSPPAAASGKAAMKLAASTLQAFRRKTTSCT
jgi:hypothetical protein